MLSGLCRESRGSVGLSPVPLGRAGTPCPGARLRHKEALLSWPCSSALQQTRCLVSSPQPRSRAPWYQPTGKHVFSCSSARLSPSLSDPGFSHEHLHEPCLSQQSRAGGRAGRGRCGQAAPSPTSPSKGRPAPPRLCLELGAALPSHRPQPGVGCTLPRPAYQAGILQSIGNEVDNSYIYGGSLTHLFDVLGAPVRFLLLAPVNTHTAPASPARVLGAPHVSSA